METARPALEALRVDWERVPVITRDQVKFAKPDPDLSLPPRRGWEATSIQVRWS